MTIRERDETRALVVQAVHGAMPEALAEALGPEIKRAVAREVKGTVSHVLRRYVLGATIGYVILAAGLGYVIHDNRVRSTQGRAVLCKIITQGDSTTYAYHREGLLNKRQLRRALRQSAEYRRQLGPAPACAPTITPPPPKGAPRPPQLRRRP